MNNPLIKLRQLINPNGASQGVIISIHGAIMKIATNKGLMEIDNPGGFIIGEPVNIQSGRIFKRFVGAEYWL